MNPLRVLSTLQSTYRDFVETFQDIKNDEIRGWLHERIEAGDFLWRPPFLTIQRRFQTGAPLEGFVAEGLLHPSIPRIFRSNTGDPGSAAIKPRKHQSEAWDIVLRHQHNCVITTGTGSGKSYCFAVPVVSAALTANETAGIGPEDRRGVKALQVYPMNALANSQYDELAARLRGTGLTVCNYTRDLRDDPEHGRQAFIETMGREPWDSDVYCRQDLRSGRGADILITNYVMLELILTRFEDRNVFPFGGLSDLKYLVFDELHTYSGRQGADVACLIRRLKEHTRTKGQVRCIATSATIDSSSPEEANKKSADFASLLFGEPFGEDDVVSESYGSFLTAEIPDPLPPYEDLPQPLLDRAADKDAEALAHVANALCGKKGSSADDLSRQATVHFLERSLISVTEQGRGQRAERWDELVERYAAQLRPDITSEQAQRELSAALIAGYVTTVETPEGGLHPLLLPKVHAFFGQGQTVTSCLSGSHLSVTGESICSQCDDETPAFPVVFCAACGQECYCAEIRDHDGAEHLHPRSFLFDVSEQPVYVFPMVWDPETAPPDESALKRDGTAKKGKEGAVPRNAKACPICGVLDGDCEHAQAIDVAIVAHQLLFCPSCGVIYDGRSNEYNKFTIAGVVGRASATDVIVSRALRELPTSPANPKRKVIVFTDNRQDAAFQSAHLNDVDRRIHFRQALYEGLRSRNARDLDTSIDLTEAGAVAYQAMAASDTLPDFAAETAVEVGRAAQTASSSYRRYLGFVSACELIGRPRRINPSLEAVGLLSVTYDGIAQIAEDNQYWEGIPELKGAPHAERQDMLQVLLDVIRRAGAINHDLLNDPDTLRDAVLSRIREEVQFHDSSLPHSRPTVFSDTMPTDARDYWVKRLAGAPEGTHTPAIVRWLAQTIECHDRDRAREIVRELTELLASERIAILARTQARGGQEYYQIADNRILLYLRDLEQNAMTCPRCRLRWEMHAARACPACVKVNLTSGRRQKDYFRDAYLQGLDSYIRMLAAEHSAQVPGDDRRRYEQDFENAEKPLNVVVCTPTMELGIDIGGLSAAHMRNVPPSPANYAQRQGRAGRHGQSSIVSTFCSTFGRASNHDQYFFRFPGRMISGLIAPPRFLLDNRPLLQAHLNALVLQIADLRILTRPREFLCMANDSDVASGLPMMDSYLDELRSRVNEARASVVEAALAAFEQELVAVHVGRAELEQILGDWADNFDHAFDSFRDEYQVLQEELTAIHARSAHEGQTNEDRIREATLTARLSDMRDGRGDFYPYRHLGNRGFLPNYAFPRRASRSYFTDRKEDISRIPAIALREFAPLASIYYRGRRYRVVRAQPRTRGQAQHWSKLKACGCGAFYLDGDVASSASCTACGRSLVSVHSQDYMLELPDAVSRQAGRISADEEERTRRGFNIQPYYRIGAVQVRGDLVESQQAIGRFTYAHHGELLLVNHGAWASDEEGFRFCDRCRAWIAGDGAESQHLDEQGRNRCPAGGTDEDLRRDVRLFTKGIHDLLILEVGVPLGCDADEFGWSLLYALTGGFQVAFCADENEIRGHLFPVPEDESKVRILLYEQDEGGMGLLDNMRAADAWRRVATRSLEILHADPNTLIDSDRACERACYDCLLSFYNQQQHEVLNRRIVIPFLGQLLRAGVETDESSKQTWEELAANGVGCEPEVIREMARRNLPPPTKQHEIIRDADGVPIAEADLLYPGKVVVWVQSPLHTREHTHLRDEQLERLLRGLGYRVVAIWPDRVAEGILDLAQRLGLSLPEA